MNDEVIPQTDESCARPSPNQEAPFARAMDVARRGMRKYRNALKELAGVKAERPKVDDA